MFYIAGVGFAEPATYFQTTPRKVASCLGTKEELSKSFSGRAADATTTPTELGVQAAEKALAAARLNKEDVELCIGESATPLEVTPSEGQRIAGKLGVKIPAYDILGGGASFAAFADYILSAEQSLPDHMLWCSANTPTRLLESESALLSDAGAAVCLSKESGQYKIVYASFMTDLSIEPLVNAPVHGPVSLHVEQMPSLYANVLQPLLFEAIEKVSDKNTLRLIMPMFDMDAAKGLVADCGLEADALLEPASAESFSCSFAAYFEQDLSSAETIVVLQGGVGYGQGYVVLEKV